MSRENPRSRPFGAALLCVAGVLTGVLGCQAIADIPDVSYSARCNEYCDQEFNVCAGVNGQYEDRQTCLETCIVLDANAQGADGKVGNTIPCRLDRLRAAAQAEDSPADLRHYCTQAGPGGGDACTGTRSAPDCEAYCTLYGAACGGDSHNPFMGQLPNDNAGSQSDCIEKCVAIAPATVPNQLESGYTWDAGSRSGDTLACRLYFVSAAVVDPVANCDRAGIRPSGECLGPGQAPSCPNFCLALTTACQNDLKVYEDYDQCLAVCQATDAGTKQSIDAVNTIGCRTAHAFNALLIDPVAHCPHVSALGAGVCGDAMKGGNCEAYCSLAAKACSADFASKFANHDDCAEKCADLPGAEDQTYKVKDAQKGGNNVQCRGLAVSRALALPEADRAAACSAVFGGGLCSN